MGGGGGGGGGRVALACSPRTVALLAVVGARAAYSLQSKPRVVDARIPTEWQRPPGCCNAWFLLRCLHTSPNSHSTGLAAGMAAQAPWRVAGTNPLPPPAEQRRGSAAAQPPGPSWSSPRGVQRHAAACLQPPRVVWAAGAEQQLGAQGPARVTLSNLACSCKSFQSPFRHVCKQKHGFPQACGGPRSHATNLRREEGGGPRPLLGLVERAAPQ